MQKVTSVEEYIEVNSHFSDALSILRRIINTTELEETIKWSMPTYCLNGKNVLGIGAFKNHFCIWFHHGIFLKDTQQLLYNAQEEKTKAMRQMRFETVADINEAAVLAYVKEAIENQHLGRAIKLQRNIKTIVIPNELKDLLKINSELKTCFKSLSLSKQREYCEYISEAKRATTKQTRLDKITPMIRKGIGLHDKYRKL
ncbi:YdeI/OmpD-associated family protein [Winogradskyella thalassocola]|uniref:Uncharacterized conserved protein YdeI, YjbR/CyaY-like superfamily, DUF1801 family n=1 Tax=Winogradskyella thalassocola TaxID=262004 RepID=A0A1G8JP76_9FLAO|nr:DUF1801 domain-containing protein [Winogradskyella thalassocola]SDI32986.1 Uncharacterized conserved protein YdeI, YjbR/CyaY-like superfamily, DUF1801 family [Winogradskyella thalassocola]